MAVVAAEPERSDSHLSTAGQTTATSTRLDACYGRLSKSMEIPSVGLISSSLLGKLPLSQWVDLFLVSVAAVLTFGNQKTTSTGVAKMNGSVTIDMATHAKTSKTLLLQFKWASFT
jgi:hypothetical protein